MKIIVIYFCLALAFRLIMITLLFIVCGCKIRLWSYHVSEELLWSVVATKSQTQFFEFFLPFKQESYNFDSLIPS